MEQEDLEIGAAKVEALQRLAEEIAAGRVDAHLAPFLHSLNRIPGVATEYSCHGHSEVSSPVAFVILALAERHSQRLYENRKEFLKNAPFQMSLEFKYLRVPKSTDVEERVWIGGDLDHIGEDCLPMFHYLTEFLRNG